MGPEIMIYNYVEVEVNFDLVTCINTWLMCVVVREQFMTSAQLHGSTLSCLLKCYGFSPLLYIEVQNK